MASIFERTWTAPNGETRSAHRVKYRDDRGRTRFKQFPTRRQAARFVEGLDKVRERGAEHRAGAVAFKDVAERFIAACEAGRDGGMPLEPTTIKGYRGMLKDYVLPELGELAMREITHGRLRQFRDAILQKPLTRRTHRKIVNVAKGVIGYALGEEIIKHDPRHDVGVKMGGRHENRSTTRLAIPSKDQMRHILETALSLRSSTNKQTARTWKRYAPLVHLLVYSGMRPSEARGLPRDAIDFRAHTVEVKQRADAAGRLGPPKTKRGYRTIYLPKVCLDLLSVWLKEHNHELAFPSRDGTPLLPSNMEKRMWRPLLKAARVPHFNLYSTRHFFASRMIEAGANLKRLSEQMGHSDEAFTLRVYGHLFKDLDSIAKSKALSESLVLA